MGQDADHGETANHDHAATIGTLHSVLAQVVRRLHAYVDAHGPLDDREDETFATAHVALAMAKESGLVDAGGAFSERLAVVPLDDDFRQIADTVLDEDIVEAGMKVCDRMHADHMADQLDDAAGRNPDPDRTDWDDGMLCVGIYRAMVRQARLRPHLCRLAPDGSAWTDVDAVSPADAARSFAVSTFHGSEGEWMGGVVEAVHASLPPELFADRFDVSVGFDDTPNRDLRAIATLLPQDGRTQAA